MAEENQVMKEPQQVTKEPQQVTTKDPKKVEAGKRLAAQVLHGLVPLINMQKSHF